MDFRKFLTLLNASIQDLKESSSFQCVFSKALEVPPPSYLIEINNVKYLILGKLAALNLKDFFKWLISYKNLHKLSFKLEHMVNVLSIIDQINSQRFEDGELVGLKNLDFFLKENLFQDNSKKMDPKFEEHDHFTLEALYYALCQADRLKVLFGKAQKLGGELTDIYTPLILDVLNSLKVYDEKLSREVFDLKLLMLVRAHQYDKALDLLLRDYEDHGNVKSAYRVFTLALGLTMSWKKKRDVLEREAHKLVNKKNTKSLEKMSSIGSVENRSNSDFLAFSNYTYSIWLRIARKNSDVVYKQPKMFQGFLDLCFMEGFFKEIKEHLYDNPVLNPLNFYKKKEEKFYKAKYNLLIGKTEHAFLVLTSWLYEAFEKKDMSELTYFYKYGLQLLEQAVFGLNQKGSTSFRLKTIAKNIDIDCMPYDPDKPRVETYGSRRVKSRPREKGAEIRAAGGKSVEPQIKSMDISDDKSQAQRQTRQDTIKNFQIRTHSHDKKPKSETTIDKKVEVGEVKLSQEEFLNMLFCVLFRIVVQLQDYTPEELKDKNISQLVKRLYLLELNVKIYYEEFTKEPNTELITTIANLISERRLGVTYDDIEDSLKYLPKKGWRYLVDKILPENINSSLATYQLSKNTLNAEALLEKRKDIVNIFLLYNSIRCDSRYHTVCNLSKREIYSIALRDVQELNHLMEVVKNPSSISLEDFLERLCLLFENQFNPISRRKLDKLALPGKCEDGSGPEIANLRKRHSEIQVRGSITVYEIMYWYALQTYSEMNCFINKRGLHHYVQIYKHLGLQDNLGKIFYEEPTDPVTELNKLKRKNLSRSVWLAGEFYNYKISQSFSIPSLFKYSKKVFQNVFSSLEMRLPNAKVAPLDNLQFEEIADLLYLEEQYRSSYTYILGQYFYTLGLILVKDTKHDVGKRVDFENKEDEDSYQKVLCKLTLQEMHSEFYPKFKFFNDVQQRLQNSRHKLELDAMLIGSKVFGLTLWDFIFIYNQIILVNTKTVHAVVSTKKNFQGPQGPHSADAKKVDQDEIINMIEELEKNIEFIYNSDEGASNQLADQIAQEAKDNEAKEKSIYAKGWKWIFGFVKVVLESIQIAYPKDSKILSSVKNPDLFKHVVGWSWPLRSLTLLGLTFAELTEDITSRKAGKLDQPESINEGVLSGDLHSFQLNINYDFPKAPKGFRGQKENLNPDDMFKDWNFDVNYQIYQEDNFIKTSNLENMKERLFMEKGQDNLTWTSEVQQKTNFVVNIIIDLLGALSRSLVELVPTKFETFEERFLLLLEPAQKEENKELIKVFMDSQKGIYTELRKSLAGFYGVLNDKLRNVRQYLEAEIALWKDNTNIVNVFNKAKKKLRNALKNDVEEEMIDNMLRQYIKNNIKAMEKLVSDINMKNSILAAFRSSFSSS